MSLLTAWILPFQKPLMLVGVNGGVLDGIVELLEHCLTQVCFLLLVVCYISSRSVCSEVQCTFEINQTCGSFRPWNFLENLPDHWKVVDKAKYSPCTLYFLAALEVYKEIFECVSVAGKRQYFGTEGWPFSLCETNFYESCETVELLFTGVNVFD